MDPVRGILEKGGAGSMSLRMKVFFLRSRSIWMSQAVNATKLAEWWVFIWSVMKIHSAGGSVFTVAAKCATQSASVRVSPMEEARMRSVATSKLAISAWGHGVRTRTRPHRNGWGAWDGTGESAPEPEARFSHPWKWPRVRWSWLG
jgi:hypothetical protein